MSRSADFAVDHDKSDSLVEMANRVGIPFENGSKVKKSFKDKSGLLKEGNSNFEQISFDQEKVSPVFTV